MMEIKILDHGYVKYIEHWGKGLAGEDEAGIIEAARQSTQGSFRGWEKDEKLLRFLKSMKHDSPFEFAGMVIEIQAPIFVFREWHRHRTQSYNEMSARYAPLPNLNYVPSMERLFQSNEKNKQVGTIKGSLELTEDSATHFLDDLQNNYQVIDDFYQTALTYGIPKELARICLPVGRYSRMRASANLRNWLAFLLLRMDPAAQWEIRQYAEIVGLIVSRLFPRTWSIFQESLPFNKKS